MYSREVDIQKENANNSNNKDSTSKPMPISRTAFYDITTPKVFYTEFKWTLQNCRMLFYLDQKVFRSCGFTLTGSNQTCFLSLNVSNKDFNSYLHVNLEACKRKSLKMIVNVSIVKKNGEKVRTLSKITNVKDTKDSLCFAMPSLTDLRDTDDYLVDNTLTFFCEIEDVQDVCNKH
ncbi:hypothetical protein TSAR_014542 [Trichomalopsis sarcophagae]|uniref:MATH domain-containing protein n=1 Tax=Trichomalopsis sarcophagae TaxID=543379 RepID=A0A232ELF9_9HYME|nr:hypothetical protein TSAR_014542 [Trichomalopsis sarcophagae]